MELDKWKKFNDIVYFVLKLAYTNFLWLVFTFVGLVLFGLFPATGAMFSVIKKVIKEEKELKIFRSFWEEYRKHFFKLNGFGLLFLFIAYFIYFDLLFLSVNTGKLQFLFPIIILIGISSIITLLFFFPVYIHFELRFFQYIKQAFFIAITCPKELILIILTGSIILMVTYFIPGVILLFPGSVFTYFTIKISMKAFEKIKIRKGLT